MSKAKFDGRCSLNQEAHGRRLINPMEYHSGDLSHTKSVGIRKHRDTEMQSGIGKTSNSPISALPRLQVLSRLLFLLYQMILLTGPQTQTIIAHIRFMII